MYNMHALLKLHQPLLSRGTSPGCTRGSALLLSRIAEITENSPNCLIFGEFIRNRLRLDEVANVSRVVFVVSLFVFV